MRSSLTLRLKALSSFQLALLVLAALALLGSSTAVASNMITGADVKDRSLTGRDLATASVTHTNLDNETVLSQDIKDGHVTSADIKDGTVQPADLSAAAREQLAKSGTGGGAKGEKGDTGPQGRKGDAGAPGAGGFLVKDAEGTIAGPLVKAPSVDRNMMGPADNSGSFYYKGRIFDADFRNGNLAVNERWFSYTTSDCSGTPYATYEYLPQSVLSNGPDLADNLYEIVGEDETIAVKSQGWNGTCMGQDYSTPGAPLRLLSAAATPTLHGSLRIVPAS